MPSSTTCFLNQLVEYRLLVAALLLAAACGKKEPPPPRWTAVGTMILDPAPGDETVRFATEVEVVKSARIAAEAARIVGTPELGAKIDAAQRKNSRVLEVRAAADDPMVAAQACNAVIRAYVDQRRRAPLEVIAQQEAMLAARLDELGRTGRTNSDDYARVQDQLRELDVLRMAAMKADVHVLDPCPVPR